MVLSVFACICHAQSPRATVEVSVQPEGELTFKQRGELIVRFLTNGFAFAKPPLFPDIRIVGGIVVPPTSGMNFSERREGDTWIGIERRYQLYPAQSGVINIPSVMLRARVRNADGVSDVSATSAALTRQVRVPPEIAAVAQVVVTSKMTVQQQWEPDVNELKVGEAIQRTLRMTAENTTAMLLPTLSAVDIKGLAQYPGQPQLDDRDVRGSVTAARTDSMTYLFERAGRFTLPDVTLYWWHPETRELHTEVLPGYLCVVSDNPALAAAASSVEESEKTAVKTPKQPLRWFLAFLCVGVLLWVLLRTFGSRVRQRWTAWQQARAESEPALFRNFERACAQNDPHQALQTLRHWLDRSLGTDWTLEGFCARVDVPTLQQNIEALNAYLFGDRESVEGKWLGRDLSAAVSQARSVVLHRQQTLGKETVLCEMYPTTRTNVE